MGQTRVDRIGGATLVASCEDDPYTSPNRVVVTFEPGLLLQDVMITMLWDPADRTSLDCTFQRADAIDGEPSEELPPEIQEAALEWIYAYRDFLNEGDRKKLADADDDNESKDNDA